MFRPGQLVYVMLYQGASEVIDLRTRKRQRIENWMTERMPLAIVQGPGPEPGTLVVHVENEPRHRVVFERYVFDPIPI
jgi:hypothetical protein